MLKKYNLNDGDVIQYLQWKNIQIKVFYKYKVKKEKEATAVRVIIY